MVTAKSWVLILGILLGVGLAQATEFRDPRDLVDTTIETLRENVTRDQALIERDPEYAVALVEGILSPHVDLRLASRLVLGKHWGAATEVQREAFSDGLRRLMLRIIALHVKDYRDAAVAYSATVFKGETNQRALVRTRVSKDGGPQVSVDYRLYQSADGWKVYDLSILGISLVKTYHITIEYELKKHGLDGVIEQINAKMPLQEAGGVTFVEPPPAG